MKLKLNPDKLYYSIGEVSDMFNVSNSLIRYWESEFRKLKPQKNARGDRKYTVKDIRTIEAIYVLLKDKGYTIDGAKKVLREEIQELNSRDQAIDKLMKLKEKLASLRNQIENL